MSRGRTKLLAGVSFVLLSAALLGGRSSPGETPPPAVRAPVTSPPAPPAPPSPPARRAPPRSRGLDAKQIPLLAPRWQLDLRPPGESRAPLRVALTDALIVQEGSSLLRLRLTDGEITARERSPLGSAEPGAAAASGSRLVLSDAASVLALDGAKFGKGQLATVLGLSWPRLKSLDLSNVGLGLEGAKLVAAMKAPQLELLDLTYTRLTDAGAMAVLSAPLLDTLKEVSLRANKLTAAAIAPVLKRKHSLRLLNLKKNALSAAELKALEKKLPDTRLSR